MNLSSVKVNGRDMKKLSDEIEEYYPIETRDYIVVIECRIAENFIGTIHYESWDSEYREESFLDVTNTFGTEKKFFKDEVVLFRICCNCDYRPYCLLRGFISTTLKKN